MTSATYSAREAAAVLGVARGTIYRLADAGLLPVVCVAPLRLSRARLDALVRADGWQPAAPERGPRIVRGPQVPYESQVLKLVAAERGREAAR